MHITVYSASSGQVPKIYMDAAHQLGKIMAQRGHILVNGAGCTGLMGAMIDSCMGAGGQAIGVIPEFMIREGWQHKGMTRLEITPDMHRRKERMAEMSDACIALPGGVGTLEELLEIMTWKQLGLYLKPIVVLNINGYYDALFSQLERAADETFMRQRHKDIWRVATTPEEAVDFCEHTPLWDASVRRFAAL